MTQTRKKHKEQGAQDRDAAIREQLEIDEVQEAIAGAQLAAEREAQQEEIVEAEQAALIEATQEKEAVDTGFNLKRTVESMLFAADRPITASQLRQYLGAHIDRKDIQEALDALVEEFRERGIVLHDVAGGYQFRTHPASSAWIQKLIAGRPVRLSKAQLDTLAIIAYRQPITRPEIDDIRGVDSGGTLRVLLDRNLLRVLGKKEEVGRPLLYGTSRDFLEFFNLAELRDLPTLREFQELNDEGMAQVDKLGADIKGIDVGAVAAEVAAERAAAEAAAAEAAEAEKEERRLAREIAKAEAATGAVSKAEDAVSDGEAVVDSPEPDDLQVDDKAAESEPMAAESDDSPEEAGLSAFAADFLAEPDDLQVDDEAAVVNAASQSEVDVVVDAAPSPLAEGSVVEEAEPHQEAFEPASDPEPGGLSAFAADYLSDAEGADVAEPVLEAVADEDMMSEEPAADESLDAEVAEASEVSEPVLEADAEDELTQAEAMSEEPEQDVEAAEWSEPESDGSFELESDEPEPDEPEPAGGLMASPVDPMDDVEAEEPGGRSAFAENFLAGNGETEAALGLDAQSMAATEVTAGEPDCVDPVVPESAGEIDALNSEDNEMASEGSITMSEVLAAEQTTDATPPPEDNP